MVKAVNPVSVFELRKLFSYDPETGELIRLTGRFAGTLASARDRAYVGECDIRVARIIWAIVHGYWPSKFIDHRDGNQLNFKLSNLREATPTQNQYNKVGVGAYPKGVTFKGDVPRTNPWQAKIRVNGRRIHLGSFPTMEDAAAAYRKASLKCHGEFSLTASVLER